MRSVSPQEIVGQSIQQVKWVQSVHKILNGGLTLGTPKSKNVVGVYNEFDKDNSDGVLVRIGASGTTEQKYTWQSSNVGIPIFHGLMRQPVGFKIVDKDKAMDVYRTVAPDETQITLAPTDNTANVTVYIF